MNNVGSAWGPVSGSKKKQKLYSDMKSIGTLVTDRRRDGAVSVTE